jgi:hypothetical protein
VSPWGESREHFRRAKRKSRPAPPQVEYFRAAKPLFSGSTVRVIGIASDAPHEVKDAWRWRDRE